MSEKTLTTDVAGVGNFYVMFGGSLVNTLGTLGVGTVSTGFKSSGFYLAAGPGTDYDGANYATYHRFTYEAAYE